tara:strand:+ start:136 stop:501 length:366 start_codon:yes stop_codon:yes gene_type:complete
MPNAPTVRTRITGRIAKVTLSRASVYNAPNEGMVQEVTDALKETAGGKDVQAIVLSEEGKSFCADADIEWMRQIVDNTEVENLGTESLLKFLDSQGMETGMSLEEIVLATSFVQERLTLNY